VLVAVVIAAPVTMVWHRALPPGQPSGRRCRARDPETDRRYTAADLDRGRREQLSRPPPVVLGAVALLVTVLSATPFGRYL
jgi:hypothetical protein